MQITPVFNLNGQCDEAVDLYQRAFGAKVDFILRYTDADPRGFIPFIFQVSEVTASPPWGDSKWKPGIPDRRPPWAYSSNSPV